MNSEERARALWTQIVMMGRPYNDDEVRAAIRTAIDAAVTEERKLLYPSWQTKDGEQVFPNDWVYLGKHSFRVDDKGRVPVAVFNDDANRWEDIAASECYFTAIAARRAAGLEVERGE